MRCLRVPLPADALAANAYNVAQLIRTNFQKCGASFLCVRLSWLRRAGSAAASPKSNAASQQPLPASLGHRRHQIQLKINDPSRLPELEPADYPPAGGFRLTYAARCNELMLVSRLPFCTARNADERGRCVQATHEPLIILVENLAAEGSRTLDLSRCRLLCGGLRPVVSRASRCPGIETLDLRPVTMALLHNVYFTGMQEEPPMRAAHPVLQGCSCPV